MVHLYALADHPAQLPALPASLASRDVGGIDAIFGEWSVAPTEADEETILEHARVVEELAALNEAVLPARLSAPYDNEAELVDAIRARAPELRDALVRVRGCVEMGVRVVRQPGGGRVPAASGTEYMRRRLETVRHADVLAKELDAAVAATTRDKVSAIAAKPDVVLVVAYLLQRDASERFRAAVETVAATHPDLAYVCVGPWPPYSFALVEGERR